MRNTKNQQKTIRSSLFTILGDYFHDSYDKDDIMDTYNFFFYIFLQFLTFVLCSLVSHQILVQYTNLQLGGTHFTKIICRVRALPLF